MIENKASHGRSFPNGQPVAGASYHYEILIQASLLNEKFDFWSGSNSGRWTMLCAVADPREAVG